jgi:hypothetical protein
VFCIFTLHVILTNALWKYYEAYKHWKNKEIEIERGINSGERRI